MGLLNISDLAPLKKRLADLVGEDMAEKWVKQSYQDRVSYGLPADKKGNYTSYGTVRNIDVRPERYLPVLPSAKPTVVPDKDWMTNAYGTHSILQGIRMPETSASAKYPSENVLTHEGQHHLDVYAGGNELNTYKSDTDNLRKLLYATEQAKGPASKAFTGRGMLGEALPEVRDYASRLPAWTSLVGTDFFKQLPNEVKAMVLRRLNPMPKNVDAVAGVDYNF